MLSRAKLVGVAVGFWCSFRPVGAVGVDCSTHSFERITACWNTGDYSRAEVHPAAPAPAANWQQPNLRLSSIMHAYQQMERIFSVAKTKDGSGYKPQKNFRSETREKTKQGGEKGVVSDVP